MVLESVTRYPAYNAMLKKGHIICVLKIKNEPCKTVIKTFS